MQSNLIIYSNIYPWNGRWQHGDREFMSKIWDVAALRILDNLEKKKEVELTPYQREIFECVLPCPELPRGDNPWGHAKDGRRVCLCRKFRCSRFKECRGKNGVLSKRECDVWNSGSQSGLDRFNELWEANRNWHKEENSTCNVDLGRIYAAEEFYDVPKVDKNAIPDPKVGFEYPDDEEFEDIGLWNNQ